MFKGKGWLIIIGFIILGIWSADAGDNQTSNANSTVVEVSVLTEEQITSEFIDIIRTYDDDKEAFKEYVLRIRESDLDNKAFDMFLEYMDYSLTDYSSDGFPVFSMTYADLIEVTNILTEELQLSDWQIATLSLLKAEFINIYDLNGGYLPYKATPQHFKDRDYTITHYNSNDLTAFAVRDDSCPFEVEGYNLILFTNFEPMQYMSDLPLYEKFYYVFIPDSVQMSKQVYQMDSLIYIGTKTYHGDFEYEAPLYIYPNTEDRTIISSWDYSNKEYWGYIANISNIVYGEHENMDVSQEFIESLDETPVWDMGYQEGVVRTSSGELNVRSGPGTEYEVVNTLENGDIIYIIESVDGWIACGMIWPSLMGILMLGFTTYGGSPQTALANALTNPTALSMIVCFVLFNFISASGITDVLARWLVTRKMTIGKPWTFAGFGTGHCYVEQIGRGRCFCYFNCGSDCTACERW